MTAKLSHPAARLTTQLIPTGLFALAAGFLMLSHTMSGINSHAAFAPKMKLSFELSPVGSFDAFDSAVVGEAFSQKGKLVPPQKVTVDMKKLTTRVALRDEHLLKTLEVTKYPTAVLTAITITGSDKAKGTLQFHGLTHPVEFEFAESSAKDSVKATFKLKISDWGIKESLSYMGVTVEDEIAAEMELPVRVIP